MGNAKKIMVSSAVALALGFIVYGVYWAVTNGYFEHIVKMIDKNTPPLLFISLMLVLPIVGFPISIFLVMVGIKFGIFYAFLTWIAVVPIHTLIGYYLASSLRKPLKRLLTEKIGYEILEVSEKHEALFSFVFLAVPGIPYAGKNYILPLAGVKFRYCVTMNTFVQMILGIPFIILGKSASEMNITYLLFAVAFFIPGAIGIWWVEKRFSSRVL